MSVLILWAAAASLAFWLRCCATYLSTARTRAARGARCLQCWAASQRSRCCRRQRAAVRVLHHACQHAAAVLADACCTSGFRYFSMPRDGWSAIVAPSSMALRAGGWWGCSWSWRGRELLRPIVQANSIVSQYVFTFDAERSFAGERADAESPGILRVPRRVSGAHRCVSEPPTCTAA